MTLESGRNQNNPGSNQDCESARHRFSHNKSDEMDKMSKPNIVFFMMDQLSAKWRYTWYPDDGEQLFNLPDDPDEQTNLASDPAFANVRGEMRDRLLKSIVLQDRPRTRRELFAPGVH